jgi:hypothetical protein
VEIRSEQNGRHAELDSMTEFEELNRIESAIENKCKPELQWADAYCAMKVQNATRKDHLKYWQRLGQSVRGVLADLE